MNTYTNLKTISPLDNRYYEELIKHGDYFSEINFYKYRLYIELKYLLFLNRNTSLFNKININKQKKLINIYYKFTEDDFSKIKKIEQEIKHDVKSLEYFLIEKLTKLGLTELKNFIHFGLTSEDVNNLAYGLLITDYLNNVLYPKIKDLVCLLDKLSKKYRNNVIIARTHGQSAVPTTFGKELAVFTQRLNKKYKIITAKKLEGKLNGAVGNYNALVFSVPEVDWLELSKKFVESLKLSWVSLTTQILPGDSYIELFFHLKHINSILIGFSEDIWRYISDGYLMLKPNTNEVGSSTMPHKINPIDFENAEGNFEIANSLYSLFINKLPISRLQRDLSDSTVKRNFGVALSHSYLGFNSLIKGLLKIQLNEQKIKKDLYDDWSILSEAVQILLKKNKYSQSYEQMKTATRGVQITKEKYQKIINNMKINNTLKTKLLKLTPEIYIGLAKNLVDYSDID